VLKSVNRRQRVPGRDQLCRLIGELALGHPPQPERVRLRLGELGRAQLDPTLIVDCTAQGFAISFWETGIQFLALNSCWQIDQFHRKRSGVHVEAVANAIRQAQKQEDEARKAGQLAAEKPLLRIAVWHHAVAGPEQMKDTAFLGNLQKNGVRLALHGDVHEMQLEQVGYRHVKKIQVVGSGSFGAIAADRPESTPRLYNVLEIARDLKSAKVHTRCQPKPDGPGGGWYEWPDPDGGPGQMPFHDISW